MIVKPRRSKINLTELIEYFEYQIEKIDKKMDFLKTYIDEDRYNRVIDTVAFYPEISELNLKELDRRYELVNIDDKITVLWYKKSHLNKIIEELKDRI